MTDIELFDLLRPIIMTVTGVPECIFADPNEEAPLGEYASVRPSQYITQRGQAKVSRREVGPVTSPIGPVMDIETTVTAHIVAECSVNFYRGNAMQRARSLIECNKRPDVSATLYRAGVGWTKVSPVNNLTALQSAKWEERSNISITLMYDTTDIVTINAIYSVETTIKDDQDRLLFNNVT